MSRIEKPKDAKIGDWVSHCCHCDLCEIETKKELDELISEWRDCIEHDDNPPDVWDTKLEALQEIRTWGITPSMAAEIDAMIQDVE